MFKCCILNFYKHYGKITQKYTFVKFTEYIKNLCNLQCCKSFHLVCQGKKSVRTFNLVQQTCFVDLWGKLRTVLMSYRVMHRFCAMAELHVF